MNILWAYFISSLFIFNFANCENVDKNKRHIHRLVRPKQFHNKHKNDEFFLLCPKVPKTDEKTRVSVAWIHNNKTIFSIINGKIAHQIDSNLTVKRWHTLTGQTNVLANSTRIKFEYEEGRHFYALRIKRISKEDVGIWKCRMVIWFEGKQVARRYESRKRIQPSNKSEFFTFKKRNLSDSDIDADNPITFTKPNAEFTVFSRMSKFHEVAYSRNDRSRDNPVQKLDNTKIVKNSSHKIFNISILFILLTIVIIRF